MKPNFFIVGAPKCATTNISYYLSLHSDIFISELNEPYYFCKFDVPEDFERASMIRDFDKYLKLFRKAKNHKAIGEATSTYLMCPHAPSEIKKAFPDAKIVISLRNPIERAHSSYFSNLFRLNQKIGFSEMIKTHYNEVKDKKFNVYNIILAGLYTEQIINFQKYFDSTKIKIIIFEEYTKNVENTIRMILNFLDIDEKVEFKEQSKGAYRVPKGAFAKLLMNSQLFRKTATKFVPTVTRQKIGDKFLFKQTTKPQMLSEDRKLLREIYKQEVKDLEQLLGRKLPWVDFDN
jgi:hypothetical protein